MVLRTRSVDLSAVPYYGCAMAARFRRAWFTGAGMIPLAVVVALGPSCTVKGRADPGPLPAGIEGRVTFAGEPDPQTGMFINLSELDAIVKERVIDHIDHLTNVPVHSGKHGCNDRIVLWLLAPLHVFPLFDGFGIFNQGIMYGTESHGDKERTLCIFPDKPVTAKPAETRMGKGKGSVDHWVAVVKPGRIMFELAGVPEDVAREAFRLAAYKLPIRTQVVSREDSF